MALLLGLAGGLGGCGENTCEPEGEFFAQSRQIGVIAVDEAAVYWTAVSQDGDKQLGEVWRKAKDGGDPQRLYQGTADPIFPFPVVSADATHAYWLEPCSRPGDPPCAEVRRVSKAGGTAQTLVRDRVFSFVLDGDRVYFSTSSQQQRNGNPSTPEADGAVWSMPKDGSSPPVALVENLDRLRHVAVDATHVYFVAARATATGREALISRVPKTGGAVEIAALTGISPYSFVLTDEWLVFHMDRSLSRVGKGEQQPAFIKNYTEDPVDGLVVVGDTVYFGDSGHTEGTTLDPDASNYICGAIRSIPLSGGEVKTFSEEEIRPHSLMTDGTMLYWVSGSSDSPSNTIRRSKL
ncbi:hypothetical protein [Hyalangium rubrum]|uniref:Lipoprotein n=1 Tax=Hyalangium rubrum TaxID=3103134 RepID=A0ABU5H3Y3_9BACT|nr:hypothetical protein [Hyalangium sp. s54d21]MDY7227518.1 hypothetical protein [Hyalangium sp. s54d21]